MRADDLARMDLHLLFVFEAVMQNAASRALRNG